jgi:hypothetical protein
LIIKKITPPFYFGKTPMEVLEDPKLGEDVVMRELINIEYGDLA